MSEDYTPMEIANILLVRPERTTRHIEKKAREKIKIPQYIKDLLSSDPPTEHVVSENQHSFIQASRELTYVGYDAKSISLFHEALMGAIKRKTRCLLEKSVSLHFNPHAIIGTVFEKSVGQDLSQEMDETNFVTEVWAATVGELIQLKRDYPALFSKTQPHPDLTPEQ